MIFIKLREAMEAYRRKTGERMTYQKLAKRTGIAKATLEGMGSRDKYNTTTRTLDKLCEALQATIDELIERVPGLPPEEVEEEEATKKKAKEKKKKSKARKKKTKKKTTKKKKAKAKKKKKATKSRTKKKKKTTKKKK